MHRKVEDLMLPLSEYATISENATLRDALKALDEAQLGLTQDRHFHRAVLVLDEAGHVAGKLSHWALLRCLEPRMHFKDDLRSLDRAGLSPEFVDQIVKNLPVPQDSMEGLCHRAAHTRVRDVMVPALESISADAPLFEAVRLLVLSHAQSMIVTRGGNAVGILRLTDVFEEVANRIRNCE